MARRRMERFATGINPEFQVARHHQRLFEVCEKIVYEGNQFTIISLPPRHSKSEVFSVLLPAWFLGHFPNEPIIHISHTSTLSNKFAFRVREMLLNDPMYWRLFPGTMLHPDRRRLHDWRTTRGGGFRSLGVGGGVTGEGAKLIILDDAVKEGDERSPKVLDETFEWYASAVRTRLLPGGSIVIPMTRWHPRDIAGRLEEVVKIDDSADPWQTIKFPALALEGIDELGRKPGEALWPERFPVEALERMRAMSERYFLSLYQQDPTGAVKPEFHREDIRLIKHARGVVKDWFWAFDLASTEKERSDFTVWLRGGRMNDRLYIERCGRMKANWPQVKKQLEKIMKQFPDDTYLFEKRFLELLAVQDVESSGATIQEVHIPGDKEERSLIAQDVVSDGLMSVAECEVDGIDQRELFIGELTSFPHGEHDDFVDALSVLTHVLGFTRTVDCLLVGGSEDVRQERKRDRVRKLLDRVGYEST